MITETETKRTRGRPKLPEAAKLPPPMTLRLTAQQVAALDTIYLSHGQRVSKAHILREALDKGLASMAE